MNLTLKLRSTRRVPCATGGRALAAAFLLSIGFAAAPAYTQPALALPSGALPPCPSSGTVASPCVTVTPATYPAFFTVTFQALPAGYTITNRTYPGWSADLFGGLNSTQSYGLYSSYATLPAGLISNWPAVNWLLNHKPASVVDDSGHTVTDPKTIRDVIQQAIWELLDGGPFAHYCCTLSDPFRTQYNGSGGSLSIVNAIDTLYNQALVQTGFVPVAGQVAAVVMEADGTLAYSNDDHYEDNLIEVTIPPAATGPFTTVGPGGWGAPPHGNNPGAILATNYLKVYPAGHVTIGGKFTLTFTSAKAIQGFLPAKGKAAQLTASYVNPTNSFIAGEFAGQVLALELNVDFSAAGVFKPGLGSLTLQATPLAGWTVSQVLTLANSVLGGGPLPPGLSLNDLNSTVDAINSAFDGGNSALMK